MNITLIVDSVALHLLHVQNETFVEHFSFSFFLGGEMSWEAADHHVERNKNQGQI